MALLLTTIGWCFAVLAEEREDHAQYGDLQTALAEIVAAVEGTQAGARRLEAWDQRPSISGHWQVEQAFDGSSGLVYTGRALLPPSHRADLAFGFRNFAVGVAWDPEGARLVSDLEAVNALLADLLP